VKSDGEELFRKMPSDILGSAKEELQSEWLSKVLIMDGSVSWGILEHVTCFACFAPIFQIREILFYDGSFGFCRKWEGHLMFAPFTSGWQQTETEPLIVAKGEVCNSSSSHSSLPAFLPWWLTFNSRNEKSQHERYKNEHDLTEVIDLFLSIPVPDDVLLTAIDLNSAVFSKWGEVCGWVHREFMSGITEVKSTWMLWLVCGASLLVIEYLFSCPPALILLWSLEPLYSYLGFVFHSPTHQKNFIYSHCFCLVNWQGFSLSYQFHLLHCKDLNWLELRLETD
jgi:hypothetical protein